MKCLSIVIAMLALMAQSHAEVTQQYWLGYRGFMSGRDAKNRSGAVLADYLEAGLSRKLSVFSQLDYQALDHSFEERNSYIWNNLSAGLRWKDEDLKKLVGLAGAAK